MDQNTTMRDFENVKPQVGYCGIWRGSCVISPRGTRRFWTVMMCCIGGRKTLTLRRSSGDFSPYRISLSVLDV